MATKVSNPAASDFSQEMREWIEAFDDVVVGEGPEQGAELLTALKQRAREAGIAQSSELTTPYVNTIPKHEEVPYPGDRARERRIQALIRWNAMAMVHLQNKKDHGHRRAHRDVLLAGDAAGGGFQPFLPRESYGDQPGDFVYFQGHASPGY